MRQGGQPLYEKTFRSEDAAALQYLDHRIRHAIPDGVGEQTNGNEGKRPVNRL